MSPRLLAPRLSTPLTRRIVGGVVATAAAALALTATAPVAGARGNSLGGSTASGSSSGRCAPMTSKSITGTLLGRDGYALNATIGFDLQDSAGHAIDASTGCRAQGYGAILQTNHYISGHGAPVGTEQISKQGQDEGPVDPHFGLYNLPANVSKVFIETYTRNYTGSPCGLGCAGTVDVSKYGFVNRQRLPLRNGLNNLKLVADTTPRFGGDTGTIQVYTRQVVSGMYAWSMDVSGRRNNEGWGVGVRTSNPHVWNIPALSPNQDYTMIVNGHAQRYHIKVRPKKVTKVTD